MRISVIDADGALLNVSELQQEQSAELQRYSVFKKLPSSDYEKESESPTFDSFLFSEKSDRNFKITNFHLKKCIIFL